MFFIVHGNGGNLSLPYYNCWILPLDMTLRTTVLQYTETHGCVVFVTQRHLTPIPSRGDMPVSETYADCQEFKLLWTDQKVVK